MITFICILILLLNIDKVHGQSVDSDKKDKWESGHHPFPEMNRFLNSYARIHHQLVKKPSIPRTTYSFLGYICSISNNDEHIEEVLLIFGEKYRALINTIIEEDCLKEEENDDKRDKRITKNIKRSASLSMFTQHSRRFFSLPATNDQF